MFFDNLDVVRIKWLSRCSIFCSLLLLLCSHPLYARLGPTNLALPPSIPQQHIRFERIAIEQGLSLNAVSDVLQDRQGFLWVSTRDGLNRYDGYHFKVFKHDPDDPLSLPDNYIHRLFEDYLGRLWIGSQKGLSVYNPANGAFIRYQPHSEDQHSIGKGLVTSIVADTLNPDILWIGTLGGGLNRLDTLTGQFSHYRHQADDPQSLSDDKVYTVLIDATDTLWVGTRNGGLNRFDRPSGTFSRFVYDPNRADSLSHNRVYKLFEDHQGTLWVGTRGGGLNWFKRESGTFGHYRHDPNDADSLSHDLVFAINEDKTGSLWVGTRGGLNRFDRENQRFVRYQHNPDNHNSLADNWVMSIFFDKTDILWVGTHSGGMSKFNPALSAFGLYQHHAGVVGLNDNSVWSLHKDPQGIIWIGTRSGGLNRLDSATQQFTYYQHKVGDPSSLGKEMVSTMYTDPQGTLWVGSSGLNRFHAETQTFSHYYFGPQSDSNTSENNQIYSILSGGDNTLWVGTRNGLNHFDTVKGTFVRYEHEPNNPNSLSNNWITKLFIDKKGTFWVGTDKGLNRFDDKSKTFIRVHQALVAPINLSDMTIYSMHQDSQGVLWLGARTGLYQLDDNGQPVNFYGEKQGLSNTVIFGIGEDRQGDLWLSTNRGVNRFNRQSKRFKHYFTDDGLQSNEFREGSMSQGADGQLLFGGAVGFNAFYPQDIKDDPYAPDIVITDFLLLNQSVPLQRLQANSPLYQGINHTETLALRHSDHVFSFEFAALHFANPGSNQYAYKLVGFDQDWIITDANKRFATYTNIPAGDYVFHVRGSNKDGVWNSSDKKLNIIILPAPWRTWWAYLIYLMAFTAIASYLWRERCRKDMLRHQAAEQIRESEERLSLALWGSGEQLWDWDVAGDVVHRRNTLLGFTLPELETMSSVARFARHIHPEDKAVFIDNLQRHMAGKSDNFESVHRLQNNRKEWVWVMEKGRVVLRGDDDQALRMSGVLMNVNELYDAQAQLKELNENLEKLVAQRTLELQKSLDELKETQTRLVQSEKMAALTYLVTGVAHEVNTPLGICVTVISLQLETLKTLDEQYKAGKIKASTLQNYLEKSSEQMSVAQRNILRTADLINSFKQVAVDQTHEVLAKCQLHDYLHTIINSVSTKARQTQLQVEINVAKDLVLTTYPGVWTQIITDLIENSLKHGFGAGEAGQITMGATLDKALDKEDHNRLHFTYRDNGCGMSEEQVRRVFDPFYTTNRDQGGTGLGMHIVFNLVSQKLLGNIECTSIPGGGVTFLIVVPVVIDEII
ncbi:MAG: ligand-binding sensor domain-containing protein/signal transduction histidine kinase [Phenylobacterium sp.]|jgi:ligand-binding sensor domain-containing protein/signal transduction histidine kinase